MSNNDSDQCSDGRNEPNTEGETAVRDRFLRTRPRESPVNVEALLACAAYRRTPQRGVTIRRFGIGIAASLLVMVGTGAGWWAGAQAARRDAVDVASVIETTREELTREIGNALRGAQATIMDNQEDSLKRVAVLLRDDYQKRIAHLRSEMERLELALNFVATSNTGTIR